jgi:hypothetical protein
MQFLNTMIFPGGFMPHGSCYLWTRGLIGLHVRSDSPIALFYFSIPIALVHQFRETVHSLAVFWMRLNQSSPRQAMTTLLEKSA